MLSFTASQLQFTAQLPVFVTMDRVLHAMMHCTMHTTSHAMHTTCVCYTYPVTSVIWVMLELRHFLAVCQRSTFCKTCFHFLASQVLVTNTVLGPCLASSTASMYVRMDRCSILHSYVERASNGIYGICTHLLMLCVYKSEACTWACIVEHNITKATSRLSSLCGGWTCVTLLQSRQQL